MNIRFAANQPTHEWSLFPSSGFERNSPLYFGLVDSSYVGKYGPGLGNHCNFCVGNKESSVSEGRYDKLYYLSKKEGGTSIYGAVPFRWVRVTPQELASRNPPPSAAAIGGIPASFCLVRFVLEEGNSVHPGVWEKGAYPFYAWGGSKQSITGVEDPTKVYVEILVEEEGGNDTSGFRPREIGSAFDHNANSGADVAFSCLQDLMAWGGKAKHRDPTKIVTSTLTIPMAVCRPALSDRSPKVTVCHDFKGGYHDCDYTTFVLSDATRETVGSNASPPFEPRGGLLEQNITKNPYKNSLTTSNLLQNAYSFQYWHVVDSFIYFSHSFVSPPTLEWINVCHKNGVKCLGTIITEGSQGASDCHVMLGSRMKVEQTCDVLALLAQQRGFEGYLINIENPVNPLYTSNLAYFVELLTSRVKAAVPNGNGMVLWYDAVTIHGNIQYQNALTQENLPFFAKCDGIFTNYWWDPTRLRVSESTLASSTSGGGLSRLADVYCGIDVFGRSTYKGGGFNTKEAVRAIIHAQQSIAIFAPGWSRENAKGAHLDFLQNDFVLWEEMSVSILEARRRSGGHTDKTPRGLCDLVTAKNGSDTIVTSFTSLPFATSMSTACGSGYAVQGEARASGSSDPSSPWCQQTSSEGSFAFVGGEVGSTSVLSRRLPVVDVVNGKGTVLGSTKARLLGGLATDSTNTALSSLTDEFSRGNVGSNAYVFQGTRSIMVSIPAKKTTPSADTPTVPVIVLLSGCSAPIQCSVRKEGRTEVAVAVTALIPNDSQIADHHEIRPEEYRLIVSRGQGGGTAGDVALLSYSHVATRCITCDDGCVRWSVSHLTFDLSAAAASSGASSLRIVGFGFTFERKAQNSSEHKTTDTRGVVIGRIAIGEPVSSSGSEKSSSVLAGVTPIFQETPIIADILDVKRFANGKGALLLAVSLSCREASLKTQNGVPMSFAVYLRLRFFAPPHQQQEARESDSLMGQYAFAGTYHCRFQRTESEATDSHRRVVAIPFDRVSVECLRVLDGVTTDAVALKADRPRAFLEVFVVPELSPTPKSKEEGSKGDECVIEGYLNKSFACWVSNPIH